MKYKTTRDSLEGVRLARQALWAANPILTPDLESEAHQRSARDARPPGCRLHRYNLSVEKPDPKLMCGGGFGLPEVKAIMLAELRATKTEVAVWQLPSLKLLTRDIPLRESSGLVEWHRRLSLRRNG